MNDMSSYTESTSVKQSIQDLNHGVFKPANLDYLCPLFSWNLVYLREKNVTLLRVREVLLNMVNKNLNFKKVSIKKEKDIS